MARRVKDWIEAYLKYTDNSEPPYTFRLWSAISVIASALQRKCSLQWGSLTFYPNMYIVLVAPSGRARKGTAMGQAQNFIDDLNIPLAAESTTREALIQQLREANTNSADPMSGTVDFHSSLTIMSQELTVFLGHQNNTLLMDLTDWYDCRSKWKYRTKQSGTDDIKGVYVNLFGATTPSLIKTSMSLDAIGGGLTSRIIFVYEEDKGKIVPFPIMSDEEINIGIKLGNDLESIHGLKGIFKITETFLESWIDWYTAQESNPPFNDPRFSGYIERRPNHVLKLSMIVNASRSDDMVIDQVDLDRAIKIVNLTEKKMPNTFSGVGKNQDADTMTSIMVDIGNSQEMTFAEIQQRYAHDVDSRRLEIILETLVAMEFVVKLIKGAKIIFVHKKYYDKNRGKYESKS